MAFIHSKKYGSNVQHYKKSNGDISYYIVYKDEDNKLRRVKIGNKSDGVTELYCHNKRQEIIYKLRVGEDLPFLQKKEKRFTFADAFESYLEWAKGNKSSWNCDLKYFTLHLQRFHKRELKSLKAKDFEDIKQEKLKVYSPRTVEYMLAVARQIINYAIRNDLVKNYTNPISNGRVKLPKPDNEKLGFFTYEQAQELLSELKKRDTPLMYNLTVLMLFTGARFIEVSSLRWSDINFDTNLIHFKSTKNGNRRHVYMNHKILEVLETLPRNTPFVIPSTNGKRVERMPRQWQLLVDEMYPYNKTIDPKYRLTVHSLRHTHASWMALEGADILHIKEQLGHKKIEMTLRYAHLIPTKRHELIKSISKHFE